MRLYVVRHAIAGVRDPKQWSDDSLRPLTRKGRKRFEKAARGLSNLVPEVDVVLASPFVRAWETALLLEKEAGWPHPIECLELTQDVPLAVLSAMQPYAGAASIAVVGHEPYLSRLASNLLSGGTSSSILLRKGGAICLDMEGLGASASAQLIWSLPPRVLRALC